jgi:predicted glycosyltransferase
VACTISLPWLSEAGDTLIGALRQALASLGAEFGRHRIFVPDEHLDAVRKRLGSVDFCVVEPISEAYVDSLAQSRSTLVYGGYNSLLDAVSSKLPSLVIVRSTQDNEQQEHLERLQRAVGKSWRVMTEEQVSGRTLEANLRYLLATEDLEPPAIDCRGAERSAARLHQIVGGAD